MGQGVCPGHIALEAMDGNGFGFDPIFIPYDLDDDFEPLSPGNYGSHIHMAKPLAPSIQPQNTSLVTELGFAELVQPIAISMINQK